MASMADLNWPIASVDASDEFCQFLLLPPIHTPPIIQTSTRFFIVSSFSFVVSSHFTSYLDKRDYAVSCNSCDTEVNF